jgi:hypothetical protein
MIAVARRRGWLHVVLVFQQGATLAFLFILWTKAKTFGSLPECNPNAVITIFHPFSALKIGRILGLVSSSVYLFGYLATPVAFCWIRPVFPDDDDDKDEEFEEVRTVSRRMFTLC